MKIKTLFRRYDILVAVLLFLIMNVLFSVFQQQISYNNGLEWDGVYYANITEDFIDGRPIKTGQPFVNRIAVPFLASLMGSDIIKNWQILNLIANVFVIVLLYILLQRYFSQRWLRLVFHTPLNRNPPYLDVVGMGDINTNKLAFITYVIVFLVLILVLYWPRIKIAGNNPVE